MLTEKILEKVRRKQKYILTNEDLSECGYSKHCSYNGIIEWENKEKGKEKREEYYQENIEERKGYSKRYCEEHEEAIKKRNNEYYHGHAEERKEYHKQRPEEDKERFSKYYERNSEARKEYASEYSKSHPEMVAKRNAKRKGLGFEPLNEWFEGCEAHHVDTVRVIHIPKDMHRSVPHNVWTGKGMEEINSLAFEFLKKEAFENQLISVPIGKKKEEIIWEQIAE